MPFTLFLLLVWMTTMTAAAETPQNDTKKLPLCPNSPNCVSSQATDSHFIAPFKIRGDADAAFLALRQALSVQSRTVVTQTTADTLHAEATSLVFRFVDDLDAVLDKANNVIHIRSASRIGYSDLGVNRRRIEALRETLRNAGVIE